jgi:hypothetical protein
MVWDHLRQEIGNNLIAFDHQIVKKLDKGFSESKFTRYTDSEKLLIFKVLIELGKTFLCKKSLKLGGEKKRTLFFFLKRG